MVKGASSVLLVVLLIAAFPLLEAVALVLPISSSIDLRAQADAGAGGAQSNQYVSQTTTLNGLSASVIAVAVNGDKKATAQSSGSATWADASAGQFSLDTKFSSDDLSAYPNSSVATPSSGWIYTFSSDLQATLTLNYAVTKSGQFTYGLHPVLNQMVDGSLIQQVDFSGSSSSSGSLLFSINPGRTNTFQVFDISNLHQLPAFSSEMVATFSYNITTIPEPATCSLLALGVLALLGTRRLRRRSF